MKTIGPLWVWKPSLSSRWPFSCDGVIFGKKRKIYVNIKGFAPVSVSQRKNCATRKMSIYTKLHEIFSRKDWVSCISEEINGEKSIARGVDPWTTKKHAHLVVEGSRVDAIFFSWFRVWHYAERRQVFIKDLTSNFTQSFSRTI